MAFGFGTHLVGIFADASMAIRGYSKEESFKKGALIFVSLYTVAFLIWFIQNYIKELFLFVLIRPFERPKSVNRICPSQSTKTFSGFRSLIVQKN